MDIQELKTQMENWPRTASGRLIISAENRAKIIEVFKTSGLGPSGFSDAVGLSLGTFYKILKRSKDIGKTARGSARSGRNLFAPVKVIEVRPSSSWIVSGPGGIRVECMNIGQLTELWRALC